MKISDFELERYFARWEFTARYLLCASDIEALALKELLALAEPEVLELWDDLRLGYGESMGHPLLRAEIAKLYAGLESRHILTFAGAEEAIFVLANVLLQPGDHAIVLWPGYQSLHEVARAAGAEVSLLELRAEDGWTLDVERVRREIRPNTRAIILNYPHNPTGALLDRASFEAVSRLADECGATLIADEVYRFLEVDERDRLPAAADLSARAVSIGVMSKSFALAGLRVGWLATRDEELLHQLACFKDYTTICNAVPSEVLAIIALRARARVLQRSRDIVAGNLRLMDSFFSRWRSTFSWVRPRGGSAAFPLLVQGGTIEEFAADLVQSEGVLLLPGPRFGHPGNHFRLGLGRTNLPQAVERLEAYCLHRGLQPD